jgi:hypothetical protein
MLSFIAKVYEKAFTSTVSMDSLVEHFKIDESLDSAVMTMPRTQRKTQFSRFAPVKITVSDGTTTINHWWLIYTPKVVLSGFGAIPKYDHTLGLIEPTKWLEKFPCGTLTFTQPIGGTRYTLLDVVARLINLTPFVPYSQVASTRLFSVDSTLATYLDSIKAPQLYFDKKNLREALIETFKYINAIPRLTYDGTNWTLTADFINQRKLDFDIESQILDYSSEASGENYGHKAEVYHENTIPTEDNTVPSVRSNSIVDVISYRNDSGVILGDTNFNLILSNNVEEIVSMKALVDIDGDLTFVEWNNVYLFPKGVYDTFDVQIGTNQKRKSLYWQYGTDKISGFSDTFDALNLQMVIRNILADYPTSVVLYNYITFRIEYIPYIEQMRSEQYREDKAEQELQANMRDYYATIQLNPQERINSLYQLTNNVYGQIQRLGVDTITFAKKHKVLAPYNGSNNGIYQLGDYTADGYFITNAELVYFNTFVIARYEMSKNWNRYAQFISIDKEFRPYEISLTKSDFTLRRNVIMPFMVVEVDNELSANHITTNNGLITPFMNTLGNSTYEIAVSTTRLKLGSTYNTYFDNAVVLPLITVAEKNSIKYKLDFKDTKLAGRKVEVTVVATNRYLQQVQVPYTEDDATLEFLQIELYQKYWNYLHSGIVHPSGDTRDTSDTLYAVANDVPYASLSENVILQRTQYYIRPFFSGQIYSTLSAFPVTGTPDVLYVAQDTALSYYWFVDSYALFEYVIAIKDTPKYTLPVYNIKKDGAEILSLEMHLPIIPNKEKVNRYIIGDSLAQENVLVKSRSTAKTFKWVAVARMFDKTDTKVLEASDIHFAYTASVSISGNAITIPNELVDDYPTYNYALLDSNNNIYIAVNRRNLDGTGTAKADINTIYFNFLNERG